VQKASSEVEISFARN